MPELSESSALYYLETGDNAGRVEAHSFTTRTAGLLSSSMSVTGVPLSSVEQVNMRRGNISVIPKCNAGAGIPKYSNKITRWMTRESGLLPNKDVEFSLSQQGEGRNTGSHSTSKGTKGSIPDTSSMV
jgi:hypothetical protein